MLVVVKIISIVSQMEWSDDQKKKLQALGEFVERNSKKAKSDEIIEMIGDGDILIVGSSGVEEIDSKVLENCPNLKFITVLGVGADFLDIKKATELGIKVSNLQGANSESVAEHIWGLILVLSKKIVESHNGTKNGKYEFFHYFGKELQGKTIGILGFGNIGSKVVRMAKGFDMKVLVFNRSKQEVEGVEFVELDELLKKSDVVVVALPLTDETDNLITKEKFDLMKKDAILVSSSRESIINKEDVLKALEEQKLFGFGLELDINTKPDERYYKFENVIVTPHNAFFTKESEDKSNNLAVENVEKFVEGKPQNLLN